MSKYGETARFPCIVQIQTVLSKFWRLLCSTQKMNKLLALGFVHRIEEPNAPKTKIYPNLCIFSFGHFEWPRPARLRVPRHSNSSTLKLWALQHSPAFGSEALSPLCMGTFQLVWEPWLWFTLYFTQGRIMSKSVTAVRLYKYVVVDDGPAPHYSNQS